MDPVRERTATLFIVAGHLRTVKGAFPHFLHFSLGLACVLASPEQPAYLACLSLACRRTESNPTR
jgi:hypothetical protein